MTRPGDMKTFRDLAFTLTGVAVFFALAMSGVF